jgi:hypothetical protein
MFLARWTPRTAEVFTLLFGGACSSGLFRFDQWPASDPLGAKSV